MDYFGTDSLEELCSLQPEPAISIYIPTYQRERGLADAEVFAEMVEQVRELIDGEFDDEVVRPLLERFEALIADASFWTKRADGLALFISPGYERIYRLAEPFSKLVVVGPSFHILPLIAYLNSADRFFLLGLTQQRTAFWAGTRRGLTPLEVPRMVPRPGPRALEEDFQRAFGDYLAALADVLRDYLVHQPLPLIIAAPEYIHLLLAEHPELSALAEQGIVGDIFSLRSSDLLDLAMPIVQGAFGQQIEEALTLWERASGEDRAISQLDMVGRYAARGEIVLLILENERHIWGRIDRKSGDLVVVQDSGLDPSKDDADLLDEICEMVLLQGGKTLVVSARQLPSDTGVAAILESPLSQEELEFLRAAQEQSDEESAEVDEESDEESVGAASDEDAGANEEEAESHDEEAQARAADTASDDEGAELGVHQVEGRADEGEEE